MDVDDHIAEVRGVLRSIRASLRHFDETELVVEDPFTGRVEPTAYDAILAETSGKENAVTVAYVTHALLDELARERGHEDFPTMDEEASIEEKLSVVDEALRTCDELTKLTALLERHEAETRRLTKSMEDSLVRRLERKIKRRLE